MTTLAASRSSVLWFLLLVAAGASAAQAQTIRPLVSEYQGRAQGRFEMVNNSDQPLNVLLRTRGFTVDERGEMMDTPLAPGIRVRLSNSSVRIPPRQSRSVFYEASTDSPPAWFVIHASFAGYPRREFNGLEVQLELPHIVYLLPTVRWIASEIQVNAQAEAEAGQLLIDLENRGMQFGRVSGIEIKSASHTLRVPGFPLFPGIRRRLRLSWPHASHPETLVVRTREFSFERPLPLQLR